MFEKFSWRQRHGAVYLGQRGYWRPVGPEQEGSAARSSAPSQQRGTTTSNKDPGSTSVCGAASKGIARRSVPPADASSTPAAAALLRASRNPQGEFSHAALALRLDDCARVLVRGECECEPDPERGRHTASIGIDLEPGQRRHGPWNRDRLRERLRQRKGLEGRGEGRCRRLPDGIRDDVLECVDRYHRLRW